MKLRELALPVAITASVVGIAANTLPAHADEPITITLPEVSPDASELEQKAGPAIPKEILTIKLAAKVGPGWTIQLPEGASVAIEEDGKMRFQNAGFEGYAIRTYFDYFLIYDNNGKLILAIHNEGDSGVIEYGPDVSPTEKKSAEKAVRLLCDC